MMEALTPPERAVLVLHEAFDMSHAEVAEILGISEAGARQHLRRARRHLDRDVGRSGHAVHDQALERFLTALEHGDLAEVQDLLAADVASYSDGGGRAHAARQPVLGADHVVRYVGTLRRHLAVRDVRRINVNGQPAATLWFGRQFALLALDVRNGRIREIHWIMNPGKLRYLHQQLDAPHEASPWTPS
jgi:RNA polymerase sigma-70 factor (ECF subfamily)